MFTLFDFKCDACDADFEALVAPGESAPCKVCDSSTTRRVPVRSIGKPFSINRVTTLTSKQYTAGGIHDAKRPKEKISVGWTKALT